MPKFMLLLATQKGLKVLSSIIYSDHFDILACVITFKEMISVDYEGDIKQMCVEHGIPHYHYIATDGLKQFEYLIDKHRITTIVAIGWRYLIPLSLNEILEYPIIIFHDSILPKYRGFSPTPTAIICGEKTVGVTILFASNEIDQGEIIWQKEIVISEDDYIQQVIDKQALAYAEGFEFIFKQIVKGSLQSIPQDESQATYSIWRSSEDCKINWEKDAAEIYNLIRAVSSPYIGAFTHYKNKKIIILKANIISDLSFAIRDCGKIWSIKNNCPIVICGNGMLQITKATDDLGKPVIFDLIRYKLQ
jgi:methionyl-tRNA formyltransferase